MNNDPNKRQVPVTYRRSGETRLSQPVQVHAPRSETESEAPAPPEATAATSSPATTDDGPLAAGTHAKPSDKPVSSSQPVTTVDTAALQPEVSIPGEASTDEKPKNNAGKSSEAGKPKTDIETLEQFIAYAYSRKGQRVTLKTKTEKLIAQNPRLDDGALSRLLSLAASDPLLAVPRQILLVSRDIEGFPALRAALASFVLSVMVRHPVFSDARLQAALRNVPDASSAADALSLLVESTPEDAETKEPLKGAELQTLRRNAGNLFVAWLANHRGMNADQLAALLFQAVWQPAARDLVDDSARLRALTEIEQAAGVGLACLRFRQQAIEAHATQEQALRDANDLRARLTETDALRLRAEEERDALRADLEALRAKSTEEMAELRRKHAEERTHLQHGQEQLGGRLVRRLDDAVETLEVGLSALRNKTPRVEVMVERAELVVDSLRAEIKNLKEE